MKKGVVAAVVAYTLWGLLPVYWKAIQTVPALEILAHRTVWSFVFVAGLLALRRHWAWVREVRNSRTLLAFVGSTCLLTVNWFTYIWAVNAAHVVDASLGYFINPLLTVLLGALFLGERLRLWQGIAIGFAVIGVVFLTLGHGAFPWVALVLALTFGFYGLIRKTAPLGSLEGLSFETALMSLPALAYLIYLERAGIASFGHAGLDTTVLLAGAGMITAVPLLLFAYAARRVTLATMGVLHYIAPTFQFLLGVFLYGEPFTQARLVGFSAIWLGLAIYSLEGGIMGRRQRQSSALPAE
jgi:chloramphenicol-sensitive protein RarD